VTSADPAPSQYSLRFLPAARRAIGQTLPESVASAVLEFCDSALAINPYRVGKPLSGPFTGFLGARRGTYRIIYKVDEDDRTIRIFDVEHRADAYRPR
jgi:mRNA-degrading endonuclease RelE of RelBE toxin-antitoxin system